jgi:hypothetical protein
MTPKDKATELVHKYVNLTDGWVYGFKDWQHKKQCATIAVNEIIEAIDWHEYETPNKELNYWLDVRKEIQNL